MKRRVLQEIYRCFDRWALHLDGACRPGCAVCCTQNVTMTAVEGRLLLDFIARRHPPAWLADRLARGLPRHGPSQTTNEFARACLEGQPGDVAEGEFDAVCPFLEDGLCSVYPARPFACRCFASTRTCRPGTAASLPPSYVSAVTAVAQLIEHLGQFDHWGNMLHVLFVLADDAAVAGWAQHHARLAPVARRSCRLARPLPGFLIDEDDAVEVMPLLEEILQTQVAGRTIENVLNGR